MAVFWNDLNDRLVTAFTTAMGSSSAYSTMKAVTINDRIFADAHEWATWTLPAVSVACYQVRYQPYSHVGATNKLYERTYRCAVFGLISGATNYRVAPAIDTISDNIREFYERIESVLSISQFSFVSAGVQSRSITITNGDLDVVRYPNDDIDSTRRIGVAYLLFDVIAKVNPT